MEQAVDLLRAAQEDQPGDFLLNLELATTLLLWRPGSPARIAVCHGGALR